VEFARFLGAQPSGALQRRRKQGGGGPHGSGSPPLEVGPAAAVVGGEEKVQSNPAAGSNAMVHLALSMEELAELFCCPISQVSRAFKFLQKLTQEWNDLLTYELERKGGCHCQCGTIWACTTMTCGVWCRFTFREAGPDVENCGCYAKSSSSTTERGNVSTSSSSLSGYCAFRSRWWRRGWRRTGSATSMTRFRSGLTWARGPAPAPMRILAPSVLPTTLCEWWCYCCSPLLRTVRTMNLSFLWE